MNCKHIYKKRRLFLLIKKTAYERIIFKLFKSSLLILDIVKEEFSWLIWYLLLFCIR